MNEDDASADPTRHTPEPEPKLGRPRNPDVDVAIHRAALQVLRDQGYAGMSVERVAAMAGVGKTTIYRRYNSKEELAAGAMGSLADDLGPPPDTGCARNDIVEMLLQNRTALERGPGFPMIGALLVEEQRNPELFELFRNRIMRRRKNDAILVLQRGIERGEIRADVDIEVAFHAMMGSILARHILGIPESRLQIEKTVDCVFNGIIAKPSPLMIKGELKGV